MSNTADHIVDRRALRRKLAFWRVAACALVVAALALGAARLFGGGQVGASSPHVARVSIEGLIDGDRETLRLLEDVGKSNASAVLLSIESPGGTTTGSEVLYEGIRQLAAKKPVVAVVGTMAASGAYIAALASDRIYARGNSLVGSIGVLFAYPNFSRLMDTVGVAYETVKSAPLKATPNGMEPTTPETRAALAALVADSFDWFKGLVRERRSLSEAELAVVDDGRVFSGRQALPLKLIDAVGGEKDAIAWLEENKGVAKNLPVRDWRRGRSLERLGILGEAARLAANAGLPGADRLGAWLEALGGLRGSGGLLAVWRAPVETR